MAEHREPTDPSVDGLIARLESIDPASVLALGDIAAERLRQIEAEGWTPAHDDSEHASGDLSLVAAAYLRAPHTHRRATTPAPAYWPWHLDWWKPGSLHRNRVKAGALVVAELARHLRLAPSVTGRVELGSRSNTDPQPETTSAAPPSPAAVVDYTERARELWEEAYDSANHIVSYGKTSKSFETTLGEIAISMIAAALSGVASERDAALLARLREPEMQEAVEAAIAVYFPRVKGDSGALACAALAVITEKLT